MYQASKHLRMGFLLFNQIRKNLRIKDHPIKRLNSIIRGTKTSLMKPSNTIREALKRRSLIRSLKH